MEAVVQRRQCGFAQNQQSPPDRTPLPPLSAPDAAYPPTDGACVPLPAWRCHSLLRPLFRRFHRLTVKDRRAGRRLAAFRLAQFTRHNPVEALPRAILALGIEIVVDRAFRREVVRQGVPLTPDPQHIQDRAESSL